VFGLGFGELLVVLLVAVVILGPKDLPRYLRKAGEMAGRLRKLAFDMREKSGIDEVLRAEGIDLDIAELRRLARGEIGGVVSAVRSTADAAKLSLPALAGPATLNPTNGANAAAAPAVQVAPVPVVPLFTSGREYPPEGPDGYGALPETASVYDGDLPASPLAEDPLYTRGESATAAPALAEAQSS
jgi:sec-independent protein translocase protein TatB